MPVVTQYVSPDLIGAIAYDGHDPAQDPNWQHSGAPSQQTYGRWCRHMCGMACLRMALLHRDGQAPSLFQLLAGARTYGAYTEDDSGQIKGLIYAPFAAYATASHQIGATVHRELTMEGLTRALDVGHMVMASVSKDIRTPSRQPERRGGHLVLAIGHHSGHIHFRNPSGHTEQTRSPRLPVAVFAEFFGGRGISLDLTPARRRPWGTTTGAEPAAS
ncbi:C39 family peptidase [Streptomyces sp. NPDC020096]